VKQRAIDRRILRTRNHLKTALIELVQEKGYSDISINDITDRANLGKATFYLHFREKDELLSYCINSVLDNLREKLITLRDVEWTSNDPRPIKLSFEFAEQNAKFIKIMLHDQGGAVFFLQLWKMIADMILSLMKSEVDDSKAQPPIPLQFLSNYYAGSILASIEWWVENDMKYPIPEMVEMVMKAQTLNRKELLGVAL
jgi:AcrR family transcriptional regulator